MYTIGLFFLAVYVGCGVLLFVIQRSLIYFPTEPLSHDYKEVTFENGGEYLKTVVLNSGKKNAILYFGGNSEAVVLNGAKYEQQFSDYSVYLVNYRGYGGSSGIPDEETLYADALYIYDKLLSSYNGIVVIGRSLGSGVACYLASERNVEKLVLVTPYDSIQRIAQKRFPLYPMSLLLKDRFNSSSRADRINAEVLILAAEDDQVVGRVHTERLITSLAHVSPSVEIIEGSKQKKQTEKYCSV